MIDRRHYLKKKQMEKESIIEIGIRIRQKKIRKTKECGKK